MGLRVTGRSVVRCPNQHEFETDMLDPEQLAIQRFVCELCGAKFSADMPPPPRRRPDSGKSGFLEASPNKELNP